MRNNSMALRTFILIALSLYLFPNSSHGADKKKESSQAASSSSSAETQVVTPSITCEADVSYTWKRLPPTNELEGGSTKPMAPGAASTDDKNELYKPIEVFYSRAKEEGPVKEAVQRELKNKLGALETEARMSCEQIRQNKAQCIATRMHSMEVGGPALDFETKRSLRAQVSNDCMKNSGICLSTKSSDIQCFEGKEGSSSSISSASSAGTSN